jgi:hypothetical protein
LEFIFPNSRSPHLVLVRQIQPALIGASVLAVRRLGFDLTVYKLLHQK